jgi:hypothetical protein
MERIETDYKATHVSRDEGFIMALIDFLIMSDLGDEAVNENEDMYIQQDRYQTIMERQYISALQEIQSMSFGASDVSDALAQFREGIAGAAAPYVEDQG